MIGRKTTDLESQDHLLQRKRRRRRARKREERKRNERLYSFTYK
jgi:hypothetical protein